MDKQAIYTSMKDNTENSRTFYWAGTINGNDDACCNFKAEGLPLSHCDDSDIRCWKFVKI